MTAPTLTPRQVVVLGYLADGMTIEQISRNLALHRAAISRDVADARRVLQANTTVETVVTALNRGLLKGANR